MTSHPQGHKQLRYQHQSQHASAKQLAYLCQAVRNKPEIKASALHHKTKSVYILYISALHPSKISSHPLLKVKG
jgi:hypothetical protein